MKLSAFFDYLEGMAMDQTTVQIVYVENMSIRTTGDFCEIGRQIPNLENMKFNVNYESKTSKF